MPGMTMRIPDAEQFAIHWWVEPAIDSLDGWVRYVLQSPAGSERLIIEIAEDQCAVGIARVSGVNLVDRLWIEGVERLWFEEDFERLFGEGRFGDGQVSFWIQRHPVPSFKLTFGLGRSVD